jgi:DNA-binding transcriptional ArsR family regulator
MADKTDDTAGVFRALADPTRRQILEDLRAGELAAGEIASRFPISGPSISRHLSVLRAAGLVSERREANRILYSLVEDRLATCVGGFLSAVCPEQVVLRAKRNRKQRRAPT